MAVTFDASGSGYDGTPAGNNDFANFMTVGSGSNRALVVGVTCNSATANVPSAVTWDQGGTNQSLSSLGTAIATGDGVSKVYLYGIVAPTSGLKTLRVSCSPSGTGEIFVCGVSVAGADQTGGVTTFAHYNTATGNSATGSVTITSASGNITVEMTSGPEVMSSPTQTQVFVNNSGSFTSAGASRAAGAATVTHQWTFASAVQWAVAGIDIVAAGGGGGAAVIAIPTLPLMGVQ